MTRLVKISLVLLVTLATFACGYFLAGEWEDDPDNWKRAFKSVKPDEVTVLHSWYWRSPHFTYEAGYFFEIAPSEILQKQLFGQNNLPRMNVSERDFLGDRPEWFAPKPLDSYDAWGYADEPRGNFRVLIDRDTGNIFLADYQF